MSFICLTFFRLTAIILLNLQSLKIRQCSRSNKAFTALLRKKLIQKGTIFMKKRVLITGASRGIGRASAVAFAQAGYDLILVCHTRLEALQSLRDELVSSYKVEVEIFAADVSDPASLEPVFAGLDSLDVLINNAGISYVGLLHEMSIEAWQEVLNTNLSGAFYTSRLAIPLMLKNHRGKILNVSSVWGNVGASMEVAYSASKAGLNGLTRALAKELAPSNIQVNGVACGLIDTDMNRCFSQEEMASIIEEIPADRIGTPAEAAAMLLQLADAPSYLTGQILTIDGGWT